MPPIDLAASGGPVHFVGIGGINFVQSRQRIFYVTDGFFDNFPYCFISIQHRFLWQVTDFSTSQRACFTFKLSINAGHNAQQRRFTSTI